MTPSPVDLAEKIRDLKSAADALGRIGSELPAVDRNVARIRASIRMLEIGVADLVSLGIIEASD